MKLLVFDWGAYTQPDINAIFTKRGISFRMVSYRFRDKNHDEFFSGRFARFLREEPYDAVFSVNYFPLVAEACYEGQIKYLSWSYDNPLNVLHIEETLGFPTNYVFLFDRVQAETYRKNGFDQVRHLPLAVNADRLEAIRLSGEERRAYASEISFVGKLYPSVLPGLLSRQEEYDRGYLKALMNAQSNIYGYYFIDELITEELTKRIAAHCPSLPLTREMLTYAVASQITRNERLLLLGLLSNHFEVSLYSREQHSLLPRVRCTGSANYLDEMPKIFKASKINLNITLKCLQTGIPLRAMDILGSHALLLSNYQEELAEHFVEGEEIAFYSSMEEALDKAAFYLSHEQRRQAVADAGYRKVRDRFSYERQFETMFRAAGIL